MKLCPYCNSLIENRRKDSRTCGAKPCENAQKRENYRNRNKAKNCKQCGDSFIGTDKKEYCKSCVTSRRSNAYKIVEQTVVCYRCGEIIELREVKLTRTVLCKKEGPCKACIAKSREQQSSAYTGEGNPGYKHGKYSKTRERKTREEVAVITSTYMKAHNPMFSKEVRIKVSKTFKRKILNGEISYPKGPDHHLWKGNREASFVIRSRLRPWKLKVMSRDNFRCVECGVRSNKLEVHHIKSFAKIVKQVASNYQVKISDLDVSSALFAAISDEVLALHTLEIGITLCKKHHAKLDPKRFI